VRSCRSRPRPRKTPTVVPEDEHQFVSRDFNGTESDSHSTPGRREIVVITVERATGEAKPLGEGVQFIV
jgi:hypothetical protein